MGQSYFFHSSFLFSQVSVPGGPVTRFSSLVGSAFGRQWSIATLKGISMYTADPPVPAIKKTFRTNTHFASRVLWSPASVWSRRPFRSASCCSTVALACFATSPITVCVNKLNKSQ